MKYKTISQHNKKNDNINKSDENLLYNLVTQMYPYNLDYIRTKIKDIVS